MKRLGLALFCWSFLNLSALALPLKPDYEIQAFSTPLQKQETQISLSEQPPNVWLSVALANHQVISNLKGVWISVLGEKTSSENFELSLMLNQKTVLQKKIKAGEAFFLPAIALETGSNELILKLQNKETLINQQKLTLYHLSERPAATFVLVDKYNFALYYVQNDILEKTYPIATGRPRTPTPTGLFIMGKKEIMPYPNTGWGVRRLLIYTKSAYPSRHWSGYALHGTNNPNSIGTEASHGCVRMFNQDVTELSELIPIETPVVIREKLPFYFEKT
ncbi:hypothetical protein COW36_21860 [bacterium (Candidatus Blackallbacteria) CG17_big_fil_post_rev_8_21_14_2_50_48_46]|uniref:L,D-TPase catalytic domain-containing protein n=1 Tax=bacterium (Candidatus Blackallbacteria) CG17_big_fil_post_rev_8_21_14_2_50_48_46 TaxID=2014261 RepID=A0A2M7FYL6_9BACT|nr:MAG: hypothetical protein COW64_11000 [bacterium (Candidatus Blackallbacteria) CG18_big_fil_WC_8_21_14_2_50_49_26]PIW14416.1 MAG: hypothetical protein COW36_21860 [bacterium (Candidatus Blackallbacteria) CG17_big_fil_post_rev_8_21_14_2_50_48_46]PIW46923.1 MAG: hypothetical protein COW20_14275 [bacterium (Candidatus Blackallbacteria) CG13_big_fil_rev_8_21_14_2_50_49_14]